MVDFNIYLKDSEVEVLNAIAEASGETVDIWIRATVKEGLKNQILNITLEEARRLKRSY